MRRLAMPIAVRWERRASARRLRLPLTHELRDQHRVGLVVADVVVVGGARVVVERGQLSVCIDGATHRDCVGGPLVSHAVSSWRPLDANRTAHFGRGTPLRSRHHRRRCARSVRALHPHHAHGLARDLQELRDAVAHPVRLHVVRIDGELPVRRIGHRVRGTECGVSWKGTS